MPRAVPVPIRQAIIERHLQGESLPDLATTFQISLTTVRRLWHCYQADGLGGLAVQYAHCGPPAPRASCLLYRAALLLRRRHPTWGAGLIRYLVATKWPTQPVPSVRTLQCWFRALGLTGPRRRLPRAPRPRGLVPHAVWQMDASDHLRLADGTNCCWLAVADEASGALLAVELFPVGRWDQVPVADVRTRLRAIFQTWGLPERLRVDNGVPWGSPEDLPPALALWLTGLGVGMIWNRPHHPQENAVIERTQGVVKQWADLERCPDLAAAQRAVAWAVEMQREHYPAVDGDSRAAAYPGLRACPRRYDPAAEAEVWEVTRIYQMLERGVWTRRVSKLGQASLYSRKVGIGMRYGGQTVSIRFDGSTQEWVFYDIAGQELVRRPALELSPERIIALDVAAPAPPKDKRPPKRGTLTPLSARPLQNRSNLTAA